MEQTENFIKSQSPSYHLFSNNKPPHTFLAKALNELNIQTEAQFLFLKKLESLILENAIIERVNQPAFLDNLKSKLRFLFPKLNKQKLEDVIITIEGIIISFNFYELFSFDDLEQLLNKKRQNLASKLFDKQVNKKSKKSSKKSFTDLAY